MRTTDIDDLRAVVREARPRPVLLLGAGASATSGVPLVWELVDLIGRHAYCWKFGRATDDPTLMRSDWYPWVSSHAWFEANLELQELYARHIKELLSPRERRRQFLQEHVVVSPDQASSGYAALASLVGKRRIHSVLTTNFETLIYDSCRRNPSASAVIQIQSPAQGGLITTDPPVSQVIHVHGVVEHYADQNLTEEVAHLDPAYSAQIIPLVGDHPLIVIGYRGAEPSVYRDLLLAATSRGPVPLPHGIFWCVRSRDGDLHPNIVELADRCGGNFALVEIEGFDEVMAALDEGVSRVPSSRMPDWLPFDGRPATNDAELDLHLVSRVLSDDALDRLALSRTPHGTSSTDQRLQLMNLLSSDGSPTNAARLLFANSAPISAVLEAGGNSRTIAGNLFQIYELLTDLLAAENEPYRIKGPQSVETRPYPPLAIKELLVNALVHRDYELDGAVEVSVDSDRLRVANPGGLLEPVDLGELGERAIRQYRNPSLAEVLYATGLMDKFGSGLIDVRRWARDGGGVATFDTGPENTHFEAVITSRADSQSGRTIASPEGSYEVFYVNALPVVLPRSIWIGPTPARRPRDIYDRHAGMPIPRFAFDGSNLLTFSDLSDPANPLREHVESPEQHDVQEFGETQLGEAKIAELLNLIFERHMQSDETIVHHRKSRVWFCINEDGSDREIEYRARMRTAKRTVARIKNPDTRRPYYEHQAMGWTFAHVANEWLLTIDPTWVFTTDGHGKLETRRRTTQFATKKMANERNQSVLNHVFFWAWAICREADLALLDDGSRAVWVDRSPIRRDESGAPPTVGDGQQDFADPEDIEHLDDDVYVDGQHDDHHDDDDEEPDHDDDEGFDHDASDE